MICDREAIDASRDVFVPTDTTEAAQRVRWTDVHAGVCGEVGVDDRTRSSGVDEDVGDLDRDPRWRHYDAAMEPLGKLTVAKAYNTRKHNEKGTKTNAVRHVPVHPTLAAMLAEWKLAGWAAMMGRAPEPDDLLVPLPPNDVGGDVPRGRQAQGRAAPHRASPDAACIASASRCYSRRMSTSRCGIGLFALVAASCGASPKPVMPPIYDDAIVLGQRVGPVSLGMSEAQLVSAVGEPTNKVDYSAFRPGRSGYVYSKVGLSLVMEDGTVVRISPSDNRYSTKSGIRVGSPLPADAAEGASVHDRGGVTSYCFDGLTALTVRNNAAAPTAPDCAVGAVCDIVIGSCLP